MTQVLTIAAAAHVGGVSTEAVRKAARAGKLGKVIRLSFDGYVVTFVDFTQVCNYWNFTGPTSPRLDDVMRERIIIKRPYPSEVEFEVLSAKPFIMD